jgi:peptidoglycan biosynthesis protein MviN/MurJ (putative lipid II flippase)
MTFVGTADVLGSTFYLARDVLVRVFYALGDGQTPFYISLAAIVANAALDWLLVCFGGFWCSRIGMQPFLSALNPSVDALLQGCVEI